MTKRTLVPTAAMVLTALGGLVLLLCLAPRKWESERHSQADNSGTLVEEDEIGWGEPVRGLRLGITIPDSKVCDFSNLLPGQSFQAGLWLENVSDDAIK